MNIDDLEQDIVKLSRKYNLPQAEIRKIWNYQFKMMLKRIQQDMRVSIKIRGLGTFEFSEKKYNHILKNYESQIHRAETSSENGDRNCID